MTPWTDRRRLAAAVRKASSRDEALALVEHAPPMSRPSRVTPDHHERCAIVAANGRALLAKLRTMHDMVPRPE